MESTEYGAFLILVKALMVRLNYNEANQINPSKLEVIGMTTKLYQLKTFSCPSCIAKIEKMLMKTKGIRSAEVLFNSSRVRVSFEEKEVGSQEIKNLIEKLGYQVIGEK